MLGMVMLLWTVYGQNINEGVTDVEQILSDVEILQPETVNNKNKVWVFSTKKAAKVETQMTAKRMTQIKTFC